MVAPLLPRTPAVVGDDQVRADDEGQAARALPMEHGHLGSWGGGGRGGVASGRGGVLGEGRPRASGRWNKGWCLATVGLLVDGPSATGRRFGAVLCGVAPSFD